MKDRVAIICVACGTTMTNYLAYPFCVTCSRDAHRPRCKPTRFLKDEIVSWSSKKIKKSALYPFVTKRFFEKS
jgi:hypothetical protein